MRCMLLFLVVVICCWTAKCFAIEGEWTLQSVLDQQIVLPTTIDEFIYRQQEVVNRIVFSGCEEVAFQFGVEEDSFYIYDETERVLSKRTCSAQERKQISFLRSNIRHVFKFRINNNKLRLFDPSFDPIFNFQRTQNQTAQEQYKQIKGEWMVNLADTPETSQVLIADSKKLSICAGAIFGYQILARYFIKITLEYKGQCNDEGLIKNVERSRFYQKNQDTLQIFDASFNLVWTGIFKPNGRAVMPQAPAPVVLAAINTNPTPVNGFTAGKYFMLLLFNRGLGRRPVDLTSSKLSFALCSSLEFQYQILEGSGVRITHKSVYDPYCPRFNEKIYFETVISIVKYTVDAEGDLTFIDQNGKEIIALSRK